MDKLAAIRIYDGQDYSDEIPVTALAENVQWDESSTLIDILGSINLTRKGNIQDQIDELNNRINQETYSKPIDGIPKSDLANSVQISLGKADTALQSYTETDPTVPAWAKQPNKPTYTAQEVGALPADSQITVEVDDTLSIQGAAADAKAVGDALNSISTSVQNIWTGRCTDRFPTTTINKTVVLDNPEGFSLVNGVVIAIKYIGNSKTVSNPCLNVNGTGNIPVIAGDDSSFENDKYHLRAWGDQGLHFFIYLAVGNNPGKWYLTNVDTEMWINLIDDFSILKDANVATAQDLGKVPTVKVISGNQVAEWQYKDITTDNTLSIQGAPADSKKVGDELTQIKQDLEIQQSRAETAQALKINKPITNPNGTNGQILQTDGQGGTSWVDGLTDEQITDAVTDWLDDHVVPGSSTIVVDDTLNIQGAAADAKKTGDELTSLKEDYTTILDSAYVTDTASGSIASFPDGADGVPIKSLTVDIKPVQSGSGDPSPDNVRPISGHTSAVVTRTGFNVWDEEWVNGRWAGNNGVLNTAFTSYVASKNKISVKPNTTYYFTVSGSTAKTREVVFYDANENWLSDAPSVYQDATFTTPSGCYYITFNLGGAYGATYNHDVSINLPNTDHNYHAYSGQTVTIDLDGTIYGGTLDVGTGVLTVDRAIVTLYGSNDENWAASGSKFYSTAFIGSKTDGDAISNEYKYSGNCAGSTTVLVDKSFYLQPTNNRIWVYDTGYSDLATFKTALGSNPLVVVYELATPQTVQLTANEISTLLGQNNIFADTGDVEVEYRADTKLYIEKLTAPTEDDMIADHAISANSFFMVGNTLYRATTAIASGATITVGTNATKLSLSDALNALS